MLRAAVGLLPDESPYTVEAAEKKLKIGAVLAALMMCGDDAEMRECKKVIEADKSPIVEEGVALFKTLHSEKWDTVMREPLKQYIGKRPHQEVCYVSDLHKVYRSNFSVFQIGFHSLLAGISESVSTPMGSHPYCSTGWSGLHLRVQGCVAGSHSLRSE